jgi:hypothetical protein
MKSFLSKGTLATFTASLRSSTVPPKYLRSVRTEMEDTLAFSYPIMTLLTVE